MKISNLFLLADANNKDLIGKGLPWSSGERACSLNKGSAVRISSTLQIFRGRETKLQRLFQQKYVRTTKIGRVGKEVAEG